jgi:hypothetical protein
MGRYEYVRGPEDQRAVFGTFVMLTFVIVWISSFVVPLVSLSSFAVSHKASIYRPYVDAFGIRVHDEKP